MQHWVVHDLERCLTSNDRSRLEELLRYRASQQASCIHSLKRLSVHLLPLEQGQEWPTTLFNVTHHDRQVWQQAFLETGIQNANPTLPVQGILLTLRIGVGREAKKSMNNVMSLLDSIEQDTLCKYLVVLGIDYDEAKGSSARAFKMLLTSRPRVKSVSVVVNPRIQEEPFRICDAWHRMAKKAWAEGADWVVLLGDDIEIDAPFHYRAFYRAFLSISERLQVSSETTAPLRFMFKRTISLFAPNCLSLLSSVPLDLAVLGGTTPLFQDFQRFQLLERRTRKSLVASSPRIDLELSSIKILILISKGFTSSMVLLP
jgi:hypothetical protein